MNAPTLAIVIPAYKGEFLDATLQSLSLQTDKNFTVYIGDDASPDHIQDIITNYKDKLKLIYKRFDTNLGGKDLVAHWNRCLKLMQGEQYFCMFSDDDIMSPECVEAFHKAVQATHYHVYHFDIDIIDIQGKVIKECPKYPRHISSEAFLYQLYTLQIDARMPEFIFETKNFDACSGFKNFDLAYRSDNATVVRCAKEYGIYTIPDGKVHWRNSGKNVSATSDWTISLRRLHSSIQFYNWLDDYYNYMGGKCPFTDNQRLYLLLTELFPLCKGLSRFDLIKLLRQINIRNWQYYHSLIYILTTLNLKHRYHRFLRKSCFNLKK